MRLLKRQIHSMNKIRIQYSVKIDRRLHLIHLDYSISFYFEMVCWWWMERKKNLHWYSIFTVNIFWWFFSYYIDIISNIICNKSFYCCLNNYSNHLYRIILRHYTRMFSNDYFHSIFEFIIQNIHCILFWYNFIVNC